MKSRLLFLFFLIQSLSNFAQNELPYADKTFLILASTKNIDEAFSIAKTAAQKTGLEFRDNKLSAHKTNGVTFPEDTCTAIGFEYPCYVARGRYDDGSYLSVEYSSDYRSFQPGYFIVIAAHGYKDDAALKKTIKAVKQVYPKSYVKNSKVYLGCIH